MRRHRILQREEGAIGGTEGRRQSKPKEERSALKFVTASFENESRLVKEFSVWSRERYI